MHSHTNKAVEQPPYQGRELVLKTREFAVETPWKSWFYVLSTFFLTNACLFGTLFIEIVPIQIALSILAFTVPLVTVVLIVVLFFVLIRVLTKLLDRSKQSTAKAD